jgi:hypothetical protein
MKTFKLLTKNTDGSISWNRQYEIKEVQSLEQCQCNRILKWFTENHHVTENIWSNHGGDCYELFLLICDAVLFGRDVPTCKKNLMISSLSPKMAAVCFPETSLHIHCLTPEYTNLYNKLQYFTVRMDSASQIHLFPSYNPLQVPYTNLQNLIS